MSNNSKRVREFKYNKDTVISLDVLFIILSCIIIIYGTNRLLFICVGGIYASVHRIQGDPTKRYVRFYGIFDEKINGTNTNTRIRN